MKLAWIAASVVMTSAAPVAQSDVPAQRPLPSAYPDEMPNGFRDRPGCVPIATQVAGEDRIYRGTRLDQQPPAKMLLAVAREVDGCPEVTFLRTNIGNQPPRAPAQPAR